MHRNKLYFIGLFFLIFLGVGVYLISKEVVFAFTQASATARVVDKTISQAIRAIAQVGMNIFSYAKSGRIQGPKLIGGMFKLILSAGV